MTDQEWELVYYECCKNDFMKKVYEDCDKEDERSQYGAGD